MVNTYHFGSRDSRVRYELISDKIISIRTVKVIEGTDDNSIIYNSTHCMIESDDGIEVYLITSKTGLFVLSEEFSYIVGIHILIGNHPLLNELYKFVRRYIDLINDDSSGTSHKIIYKKITTFHNKYRASIDTLGIPVVWYNNRGLTYIHANSYVTIDYPRNITLTELIDANKSLIDYHVDHRPNFTKVLQPFFCTILDGTSRVNKKINGLRYGKNK